MHIILLMVLIFSGVLGLFALFTNFYAGVWYKALVERRLALINHLMMTDDVPPQWQFKLLEQVISKHTQSTFWRRVHKLLYRWYIFRLDRLANTVQKLSMISKEEKFQFIEAFKEIHDLWVSQAESL